MPTYKEMREVCEYLVACSEEDRIEFVVIYKLAVKNGQQSDFALKRAFDEVEDMRKRREKHRRMFK